MSTTAGTVLVAKETSYSSIYTYYKATLGTAPTVSGDRVNFSITLSVTIGSSSGLGTGAGNNRTAYVYDGAGNLIGSKLIKNGTSWSAGQTYVYSIPCSAYTATAGGSLTGCYIRIQYSESQAYGSAASCYWNGKTNKSGGSVGNTFTIDYSAGTFRLSVEAGAGIASVSGAGLYEAGTSVTVSCTLETGDGVTYAFDAWESSDPSLLPGSTTQSYTFAMPSGAITLTATAAREGDSVTVTFDPTGGSVSPATKTVAYGEPYGTLPTPTKAGHSFAGWKDGNGRIVTATSIVPFYHDFTLYAQWSTGGGRIYVGGAWKSGTFYLYKDGAWVRATPYIYTQGAWKAGT
jgi:uncharacterized repeat protein (TIGR02543 family)